MQGNGNVISILQWREFGDDDDTVDVRVYPAGEINPMQDSIDEYEINTEDHDPDNDKYVYFHIWDMTISDGEILQRNGRKFRINITEV
jgi:hypothetical protein